jgi:uncharacterized protein (DUF952 family)
MHATNLRLEIDNVLSCVCRQLSWHFQEVAKTPLMLIYKIVPRALWDAATAAGSFDGSAVDVRDGFIHFSTAAQVPATAAKHFRDVKDLLLVAVDAAALGDALRWEPSRGGDLFPHLYGTLPTNLATSVIPFDPMT